MLKINVDHIFHKMQISSTTLSIIGVVLTSLVSTTSAIAANTQSCHAKDDAINNIGDLFNAAFSDLTRVTWTVDVGVTFNNGAGCNAISGALATAIGDSFAQFSCTNDGDNSIQGGGTSLSFMGIGNTGIGDKINQALTGVFPPIDGGFNCPDF